MLLEYEIICFFVWPKAQLFQQTIPNASSKPYASFHSSVYPPIHSSVHLSTHAFINLFIYIFYPFFQSFFCSIIYSIIIYHLFILWFFHLPSFHASIHPAFHSFIHSYSLLSLQYSIICCLPSRSLNALYLGWHSLLCIRSPKLIKSSIWYK